MKKLILSVVVVFCVFISNAQLLSPANGGCAKATVSERIGITDVTISYGRPAVRGREGKIWGDLVHVGFQNLGFGNGKESPWRAGANENTVMEFGTDVLVEGQHLPAGKYGFFIAYGPEECTLIFSSNSSSWGSYFYEPTEDVLRIKVKPRPQAQSKERLAYEFSDQTDSSATINLIWEKLAIPFTVSTHLQQLQMASFERELRGEKGFDPHSLQQVAEYMYDNNIRLEEALVYISRAARSLPTFTVLSIKSGILEKLNRSAQADSIMKVAITKGTAPEVHAYARSLLQDNRVQQAFEAFQANYHHLPNTFTTNVGMARGYSAIGKPKEALKYANQALSQAPDAVNRKSVEQIISALKDGKKLM